MNILLVFPGFIIAFVIVLCYERKIRLFRTAFRTASRNTVHFYVARDKDGGLWLYLSKPIRMKEQFVARCYGKTVGNYFSNYGLNINDYANLKWEDEPIEVFLNLED